MAENGVDLSAFCENHVMHFYLYAEGNTPNIVTVSVDKFEEKCYYEVKILLHF